MKAALITHNWKTGQTIWDSFGEGTPNNEPVNDPVMAAEKLQSALAGDFAEPEWSQTIISDDEASKKAGVRRTAQMLGITEEEVNSW